MCIKLMGPMKKLLINILLFPVFFSFAVEGGDPSGGVGGEQSGDEGTGGEGEGGQTPEEIEAAETGRRAALSQEERDAEDLAKSEADKKAEGLLRTMRTSRSPRAWRRQRNWSMSSSRF
jgi:hypothetical protein